MSNIELIVPKMGEGIIEVNVVRWLKSVGENFSVGEAIVEIATDKIDSEITAPCDGVLSKILVTNGKSISVGFPLAIFQTEADISEYDNCKKFPLKGEFLNSEEPLEIENSMTDLKSNSEYTDYPRNYSPLVKSIASKHYITIEEINKIYGKGIDGKVTKEDILRYIERCVSTKEQRSEIIDSSKILNKHLVLGDEIVNLNRLRKATAKKMSDANRDIPHVTSFVDCDISKVVLWREDNKKNFMKKYNIPLTYTSIFIWAIAKVLASYPLINSYFINDVIIKKKDINIGMAVSIEKNNLIVPVIRNADQHSIKSLAYKVYDLANRARTGKLLPEEISRPTYSVSNVGVFNTIMGTPMITPPQVGVMAIGAIKELPVLEKKANLNLGATFKAKQSVMLCHSYDHRVIDGALGGMFAHDVSEKLANFIPDENF